MHSQTLNPLTPLPPGVGKRKKGILSLKTYIYKSEISNSIRFEFGNFLDIKDIIIPFFENYPILGQKSLDFADFKKVASARAPSVACFGWWRLGAPTILKID